MQQQERAVLVISRRGRTVWVDEQIVERAHGARCQLGLREGTVASRANSAREHREERVEKTLMEKLLTRGGRGRAAVHEHASKTYHYADVIVTEEVVNLAERTEAEQRVGRASAAEERTTGLDELSILTSGAHPERAATAARLAAASASARSGCSASKSDLSGSAWPSDEYDWSK
eukprot:scaffold41911_cov31-Tisochrysis_lutea.AAC.9